MSLFQCPKCLAVMEDHSEPCWCVFDNADVDENGFVHTPARVAVDRNVLETQVEAYEVDNYLAWAALPNVVRYDHEEYYQDDPHALAFAYLLRA